jgi:fimbrial chaperone protein
MRRIEGYVSVKSVRRMLDNYESLEAGDRPLDAMPTNSGSKPDDGITGGFLNKVMLDDAIGKLPPPLYVAVKCRWVDRLPLGQTLRALEKLGVGVEKSQYYRRCDAAVKAIQLLLNGTLPNYEALLKEVKKST